MAEFTEEQIKKIVTAAEQGTFGGKVIPYEQEWYDKAASSGTNEHDFSRVDAGRIRVITHAALYNDTSACTFIYIKHRKGYTFPVDEGEVAPLTGEVVRFAGQIILGPEQHMRASFEGCTSGDDIYAIVNGYEIII